MQVRPTGLPLTLSEFRLNHFPNPITDSALIEYLLAETGPVQLIVYDVTGRRIRTFVDHVQGAGPQAAHWDGTTDTGEPAGNGVYLLRLQTSHGAATHKVVLLR